MQATTPNANVESTLNDVIEICRDAQQGFDAAANGIDRDILKNELLHYSQDRANFVTQLSAAMKQMGFKPADHGSAAGALHRGWLNLVKMKPGNNAHVILAACERGEDAAIETYTKALNEPLPSPISELVASQYQVVKSTHDRIRDLRDDAEIN